MRVLVTGAAGFIGFHVARALIARGDVVTGFDNVNDYYDVALKEARLAELDRAAADAEATADRRSDPAADRRSDPAADRRSDPAADRRSDPTADRRYPTADRRSDPGRGPVWAFRRADVADADAVAAAFAERGPFDRVIHLAAQAGVRHSLENPVDYVTSNVLGFTHVLEACRRAETPHLTYASTSSVYGANATMPFTEGQGVDHPLQFYAATKRANELMAHAYSHLYRLPTTGLRFFTVYGPWGRPDMAPMLFASAILENRPILLNNAGRHSRDFTYVDDIVEGVIRASDRIAAPDPDWDPADPDPATSNAPFRVYNIGASAPVGLGDFLAAIEAALGRRAAIEVRPLQPGDALDTYADSARLARATNWRPGTPLAEGVRRFVEWYVAFYGPFPPPDAAPAALAGAADPGHDRSAR